MNWRAVAARSRRGRAARLRVMAKPDDKWEKHTFNLPAGHKWTAKAGNHLYVFDRGAVAFEVPEGWVVRHDQPDTITLHDQPPPADSARLSLTIFRLPPVKGGWGGLPLDQLLIQATALRDAAAAGAQGSPGTNAAEVHREARNDCELVWREGSPWSDPQNGKPARSRQLFARARLVQVLITFDFYDEQSGKFLPVWNDLIQSLRVGIPRDLAGEVGN
jgi:hypothetical protein